MAATAQDSQAPLRGGGDGKKDDERDDEETEYSPFFGIEKGAVLQESRIFNDREIDARRCQQVITKLLYLLTQGETFTKKEASEVFFGATKLFQNKDVNLRRMVYLVIKDICPGADEVIIVTSSLMKDMNSKTDLYRSNSVRVLCKITDSGLLGQIERYLKQAVVDKSAVVASAVLVSGLHLLENNTEIVKRWTNEVQEAVQSKDSMVQFHAVALLHALRQNDRLAISKLVSSLIRGNVRSPLAQCLLVRYVSQVIAETQGSVDGERPFYDFLESCLRHKSEMVIFEAARAIINMENVSTRELTPAITVLQLFLSSSKPVLRFAAVRTLNKVAMTHPMAVTNCNIDMESLISDQNRSIATLAITTLLKTGNEASVERLLKQIGNFMSEIADEFKIVVVEAIRSLCLKFPQKHRALMNFLSNILREEGGFEYKKAIVDSILILIREIPQAKESGLGHLCEFIEDCEFTYLSTQVLHLLGIEGPKTADPAKYIRYIYNRIILENATVRAAAVSSLAQFGADVESLRPRVTTLIRRALHDNDDEVRDRATLYLRQLEGLAGGPQCIGSSGELDLSSLDSSLKSYLSETHPKPFNLVDVPKLSVQADVGKNAPRSSSHKQAVKESGQDMLSVYASQLSAIPEFAAFGKLYCSSDAQKLTEEETEYIVTCVQHIFEEHIVFQFNCTNTIEEQVLEKVSVLMDAAEAEEFSVEDVVELPAMPQNGSAATYVVVSKPANQMSTGKFVNTLRFTVKEVDPASGEAEEDGYEDEYQLEDVDVTPASYLTPNVVGNFRKEWDEYQGFNELEDDYGLGVRNSLEDAAVAVISTLGLTVSEGSDIVPPNSRSHIVLLSGRYLDQHVALVKLNFGIDTSNNVAMKMCVRSESQQLCEGIHQIVQEA